MPTVIVTASYAPAIRVGANLTAAAVQKVGTLVTDAQMAMVHAGAEAEFKLAT